MALLPSLPDAFHDLPDAPLLVGYSGGLDSTVLLHALVQHRGPHRLRAVHVHHGLQSAADGWVAHCRRTCDALDVALEVRHVEVVQHGQGPEAAAREARHEVLATTMQAGDVLVLAHHREDQAETFLLRALRGSGVDGLAAMRRWRGFGRGRLWRPLLDTPRAGLEAYARTHELRWIEDPGNAGIEFDRNFLRNRVLPLLASRWPHASAALAKSAVLCGETITVLHTHDRDMLAGVQAGNADQLSRQALQALDAPVRARVLRAWVGTLGLPPLPAGGVARVGQELLPARADAAACYRWQGAEIQAWRDILHASWRRAPLPLDWEADWDGTAPCLLPGGDRLELQPASGTPWPLRVRARRGGERIQLPGRTHSHALKHVLQDAGIPPWERARMPLLTTPEGELLAAGNLILSAGFSDWLAHHGARLHWRRGDLVETATPVD